MKKFLNLTVCAGVMLFAGQAVAYDAGLVEDQCKKAKFSQFSLKEYQAPEKAEVAAESDFSFVISAWIDPTTIKLTAKKKPVPFTVEDKNSFFLVKSKLPTEYNGQFVRLDVHVTAKLGCKSTEGWLVKVAEK